MTLQRLTWTFKDQETNMWAGQATKIENIERSTFLKSEHKESSSIV